jgi:hypothetical protein
METNMKKFIMGLMVLSSISTFASSKDCQSLAGKYTCSYQGQSLVLSLTLKSSSNSIVLALAGDNDEFVVDGKIHNSKKDDSQNIATCNENKELNIENYFHNQLKALVSISATTTGVLYSMEQGSSSVDLSCERSK